MGFGYSLYFTERARNRVIRWDPDRGEAVVLVGGKVPVEYAQQLDDPYGLIFDAADRLLVANKHKHRLDFVANGRLQEFKLHDRDGHRQRRPDSPKHYDPTLYCPTSLFLEPDGTILCSFSDDFTIYRIFPDGGIELLLGVTRNRGCRFGRFVEHAPHGEYENIALYGPTAVVRRRDGTIFFIERGYNSVRKFHPDRGLRSLFPYALQPEFHKKTTSLAEADIAAIHPAVPSGLALDRDDNLYLADVCMNALWQVDFERWRLVRVVECPRGQEQYGGPTALTFGPDGTAWVADSARNRIQAYQPVPSAPWPELDCFLSVVAGEPLKVRHGGLGMVCSSTRI